MTLTSRDENAKTLAKLLGLDDDEAASILDMSIVVRAGRDAPSRILQRHLVDLLARTVGSVNENADGLAAAQVLIGSVLSGAHGPSVRVGVTEAEVTISCEGAVEHDPNADVPEIVLFIGACYAAAMAVRIGIGRAFPLAHADTIRLPIDRLLRGARQVLDAPIVIGKVYLAGAGAIGNGFLRALALVDVRGELHVVDPKHVTAGNLGRCLWFEIADVGRPKAEALIARSRPALAGVNLIARVGRLQDLAERSAGPWLERLVVAVDSRRARRRLQEELPRDVFDASTTGIEEVVLHFNDARDDGACLSCIYDEDPVEAAHEQHVAAVLGVELGDVQRHYVDADAARRIGARYPQLDSSTLVGAAYDTLFKALCATGQLAIDEGRTILAPFAFVSALAGAYQALELVLRAGSDDVSAPFNYWRASPWTSPVFGLQASRPAHPNCETCANPVIRETVEQLWGWRGEEAS